VSRESRDGRGRVKPIQTCEVQCSVGVHRNNRLCIFGLYSICFQSLFSPPVQPGAETHTQTEAHTVAADWTASLAIDLLQVSLSSLLYCVYLLHTSIQHTTLSYNILHYYNTSHWRLISSYTPLPSCCCVFLYFIHFS